MTRLVVIALALAATLSDVGAGPHAQAAQAPDESCDIQTSDRIVAVGDVHGAYDQFVAILRATGLLDGRDRWAGGRAVLVQTGDILDRGADSRRVLDLLRRLERDAGRTGGRVYTLLGNHELMRLIGDWRYVSDGEYTAFRNRDSEELRQRIYEKASAAEAKDAKASGREYDATAYRAQFMRDVPLGALEMRLAFAADGDYGKWLRRRPAMVRINGILFVHGGVSEGLASLGCAGLNGAVAKDIASLPLPAEQAAMLMSSSETGPLWYRGLALDEESTLAPSVETILKQMNAHAMVIGHSTVLPGRIITRFGGRVALIDSGMLGGPFYPRGVASALEIREGTWTAIYTDRRETLRATEAEKVDIVH